MLKSAWNQVVKGYQSFLQSRDELAADAARQRIENARAGREILIVPGRLGASTVVFPLTPEQAACKIAAEERELARLARQMEQRRQKFDLSP